MGTTDLEKQNLEAHGEWCDQRYKNLETRLSNIEEKVESIHEDIHSGNKSMVNGSNGNSRSNDWATSSASSLQSW